MDIRGSNGSQEGSGLSIFLWNSLPLNVIGKEFLRQSDIDSWRKDESEGGLECRVEVTIRLAVTLLNGKASSTD